MTLPYATLICPQCSAELPPALLACANCGRLLHAEQLQELSQSAGAAMRRRDAEGALAAWREMLDLLPAQSRQYQVISQKVAELVEMQRGGGGASIAPSGGASVAPPGGAPRQSDAEAASSTGKKAAAGAGALGLLLLKFKTLLLILLAKGKILFFGLGKIHTLFSMLLSFAAYWTLWGWKFALGFVLSIYVHEMGHVVALRRYGFKASAPMFIPGIGALIRLQQHIDDPRIDAEIGLAGPIYGLGAAAVTAALWYLTKQPVLAAIAGTGALINVFNLLPIGTLDGGRAFHALSRIQMVMATGAAVVGYFLAEDGMLLLLAIVCGFRCLGKDYGRRDSRAAVNYVALVILLSLLSLMRTHARVGL
jgi:Zn-dependent protease